MEGVKAVIDRLAVRARPEDGDYYGGDGLLYCGKCKTKRESVIEIPDFGNPDAPKEKRIVAVTCRCREEARDRKEQEEKHRERMERIERMKKDSLIETRLKDATFATFKRTQHNERLYKAAARYVEHFARMMEENQGILFWGDVGTGKSFAAACIANELLARMTAVVMTSFVKILQNLKGFRDDEKAYLAKLNRPDLLIIDDLGAERNTDYALEKVYNVIDGRYRSGKPLILTTNLSLMEMQEETDIRYRRIYDRIFEMCYPIHVVGRSWREQEAARRFDAMRELMEG